MTGKPALPRILVVDDDRLILATLAMGLEKAGFATLQAASGEEAVQICRQRQPDLILMDIRMPGMSGVEAILEIHALARIPVIFLSAYDEADIVEQAIRAGGMGYLVKPTEVKQLIPQIRAVLARATEWAQLRTTESQLNQALGAERDTSIAVGILMERRKLSAAEAFEVLRKEARPNRRKMAEVAREIVFSSGSPGPSGTGKK